MKTLNNSVSNFIKELETRINMLNSIEVKANLDTKSFDEITSIVKKYTERHPKDLIITDVMNFKISDIDEILHIMGVSPTEINRVLINFNRNNKLMIEGSKEAEDFFNEVKDMIVNYVSSFIDIDKAQNDIQSTKVAEYTSYIELLKSDSVTEPFDNFDGLIKLMTSLAIDNEDKWNVLAYIAKLNLTIAKDKTLEFNYAALIDSLRELYVEENSELVELIEKEVFTKDVDIELIPTTSKTLADKTNNNSMLIQNIIVTLLAHNIYSRYMETNDESLIELLESVLNQQVNEADFVIETSKEVLSRSQKLYENRNEDVMRYIDMTIADIELEGYTHDEAVEYKSLPVLKTMAETIDKIETLEPTNPDYELCVGILSELNDAYFNIIEKQEKELKYK